MTVVLFSPVIRGYRDVQKNITARKDVAGGVSVASTVSQEAGMKPST